MVDCPASLQRGKYLRGHGVERDLNDWSDRLMLASALNNLGMVLDTTALCKARPESSILFFSTAPAWLSRGEGHTHPQGL